MTSKSRISWRRTATALAATTIISAGFAAPSYASGNTPTKWPIKHMVIIFQENVSFDHYVATYPKAANPSGETRFVAGDDTPSVNGLDDGLLTSNPNSK